MAMTAGTSCGTAVVTGATSGIGREVASILAAGGMAVLGLGRSTERCRAAESAIRAEAGHERVHFLAADFSSLAEVRRAAAWIQQRARTVQVLVNNAGTFTLNRRLTVEGLETQLVVNWLSAFLLTGLLEGPLLRPDGARVVNLSSASHFAGRIHWDDLGLSHGYMGLAAYDQSKLAMALFTAELARRFPSPRQPCAYAVDPGLVRTEIGAKGNGALVRLAWRLRTRGGISARQAAESVCWCALSPAAAGLSGRYWKECREVEASGEARDPAAARRLWEVAERMSGLEWPSGRLRTAPGLIA